MVKMILLYVILLKVAEPSMTLSRTYFIFDSYGLMFLLSFLNHYVIPSVWNFSCLFVHWSRYPVRKRVNSYFFEDDFKLISMTNLYYLFKKWINFLFTKLCNHK